MKFVNELRGKITNLKSTSQATFPTKSQFSRHNTFESYSNLNGDNLNDKLDTIQIKNHKLIEDIHVNLRFPDQAITSDKTR